MCYAFKTLKFIILFIKCGPASCCISRYAAEKMQWFSPFISSFPNIETAGFTPSAFTVYRCQGFLSMFLTGIEITIHYNNSFLFQGENKNTSCMF